jgi:hypothetical protein
MKALLVSPGVLCSRWCPSAQLHGMACSQCNGSVPAATAAWPSSGYRHSWQIRDAVMLYTLVPRVTNVSCSFPMPQQHASRSRRCQACLPHSAASLAAMQLHSSRCCSYSSTNNSRNHQHSSHLPRTAPSSSTVRHMTSSSTGC